MTIWTPDLSSARGSSARGPLYLAIAQAIAADVASGRLAPGDRLPPHRELAYRLGVTVGTVSRAYAEAERRNMITGEVGRGTYVQGDAVGKTELAIPKREESGLVDLSFNLPASGDQARRLADALRNLAGSAALSSLLDYQPSAGMPAHRAAGARWVSRWGLDASPEAVVVTNGAQHGMMVVISAIARPGDLVLCESLTFPGMKALANLMNLRLQGLAMDQEGIVPEAFEAACRKGAPKALYCMPTLQNPTTACMSEARREAIAEIALRHGVAIIEDDVYGFLPEKRPSLLTALAPERFFLVISVSKSIAPGLRVGYVHAPRGMVERVAGAVRASTWMATPLSAAIATLWIEDGTADELASFQRREAAARQKIARRVLGRFDIQSRPASMHLWLRLPEPWRAEQFAAQSRSRGTAVMPAEVFVVGRAPPPHAVRVCLAAVHDHDRLERGLSLLVDVLDRGPDPSLTVV